MDAAAAGSAAADELTAYMLEVAGRAVKEAPPALPDFDNRLTRLLAQSQGLAEAGRYHEAAQKMRELQNAPPLPDVILPRYVEQWTRERLAALRRLEARVDPATLREFYLESNPRWFKQRWQPIAAAWRAPTSDEITRLRLVADLLGQAEDRRGQRLALLALVETGKLSAAEQADALLVAGNCARADKHDAAAIASWDRVVREHAGTSAWFRALYNRGVTRRSIAAYREAIGDFTQLIAASPPDREPGSTLMVEFRNYSHESALHISDCYEALGDFSHALEWAQLAVEKHRLETNCGNCSASYATEMSQRIARLRAKLR